MAKNSITDYSATAASNVDIAGIGVQGTNIVSNFDNAFRTIMAHLKDVSAGTAPLEDTFSVGDPADLTKRVRIDAGSITTATTRVLTAPNYDGTILASAALGTAGQIPRMNTGATAVEFGSQPIAGHIYGLTLSNNVGDAVNDIDIAIGEAASTATNPYVMVLASAITKRLDAAWAVGTNQGGLDTGTVANGTYHVHLIQRSDTGVVDALFSLSASAPTMPTNYDRSRRIGSVVRAGATILAFKQLGDEFLLDVPILDIDTTQNATAATRVLTVPTGVKVWAMIRTRGTNASAWAMSFTALDVADTAPSAGATPLADLGGAAGEGDRKTLVVRTDASASIRSRATLSATTIQIATYGWIDTRGK